MITDGGPAFPQNFADGEIDAGGNGGMSLRDWFAGQALAGIGPLMLALYDRIKPPDGEPLTMPEVIARLALETADAMLAEREKEPT